MTTKHTPGPWEVTNICGKTCVTARPFKSEVGCIEIAKITEIVGRDNARLIAAAPELLEACRLALGAFEANRIDMQQNAERKLNAAIAKAEGK
jgi:hypothetical protein